MLNSQTSYSHLFNTIIELKLPYEGAGFILTYRGRAFLGKRIKKPEDVAKDPTEEVEYPGGKRENTEQISLHTAYRELVEELGCNILVGGWSSRVTFLPTFQPFSKKWIHCFLLELTEEEYSNLKSASKHLNNWNASETRDFCLLTGSDEPVRKALECMGWVSLGEMQALIEAFSKVPAT